MRLPSVLFALIFISTLPAQEPKPIDLQVTPAKLPAPALRWKLLPELRETTPGNAALVYNRALAPDGGISASALPEIEQARSDALAMSQDELRAALQKDPNVIQPIRENKMLREVDRAARRQYCDWDLVTRMREEGHAMLLPDLHSFRRFGKFLAIRARLELLDANFEEANRTMKTGFAFDRHLSDSPSVIQALVATAMAAEMFNQVEDWIRTPNSPNLFWALTALPTPFIDFQKPVQSERIMIDHVLPGFREALAARTMAPIGDDKLREVGSKIGLLAGSRVPSTSTALVVMKVYPAAKQFLRSEGWPDGVVDALPAMQAVLLMELADYNRVFDDLYKWMNLPWPQARAGLRRVEAQLREANTDRTSMALSLAATMMPSLSKIAEAPARIDRKIAALRCVEAIRLYAAQTGRLPETLADIKDVPIPNDPMAGETFAYSVENATATLASRDQPARGSLTYKITIRR